MQYLTLASLIPLVVAHGYISSPTPRRPGPAFAAACGEQAFNQQNGDINGNVQGIAQVAQPNADCNIFLCKGFQFDDNTANVQTFAPGQTIDFAIDLTAPHTGFANVSVIKTSSDTSIGEPLIFFEEYASNQKGVDPSNRNFQVTMPDNLGNECTTPGDCVLQWFWDAFDINQTYEACVDFVVEGGAPPPPPPPPATEEPAPAPTGNDCLAARAVETVTETVIQRSVETVWVHAN